MLNKKLIQITCLLCVVSCFISLFGCTKGNSNNSTEDSTEKSINVNASTEDSTEKSIDDIVSYPDDVFAIADFKCVCSTDDKTEFVIENDNAKALYTYIAEQWKNSKETQQDTTEQDCIYISFQDGEPLLFLNQEPNTETSDALVKSSDNLVKSDRHFYGVFWIHKNDYMVFTAMPMTSFQQYYKMPKGTYNKVAELIKN